MSRPIGSVRGNMTRTLFKAFHESAARWPDNALLCVPPGRPDAPEGVELSFREVAKRVDALIDAYRTAGYGVGHRVALLLENRPEHFIHFLALNALGISQTPLNPDHRPDEIQYQIDHSGADLIFCLAHHSATVRQATAGSAKQPAIVVAETWPDRLPAPTSRSQNEELGAQTEAAVLYTSGTTARPKGCILTNEYILSFAEWYIDFAKNEKSIFQIRQGVERLLNPLPVYHVAAGALSFTTMALTGGCFIMPGRFSPKRWWREVVETRATIVHYIGLVPALLLAQEPVPEEKMHSVRWGLGAGIEPGIHARFEERFGFPNVEVWGMTELAWWFADDEEPRKIGTRAFGKPVRDIEVKIVDEEDKEVPWGVPGEMLVRAKGPNPRRRFFAGYLNDADATERAWRGGWFHTGDFARQEDDGMLYFVERKKNIIRRSGENIAAAEIENVLRSDKLVAYAAVIAVPDSLRQEEVYACVVPAPNVTPDGELAERLFLLCMDKLAYYKAPGYIAFFSSLPMTQTQKVQKQKIFPEGAEPLKAPMLFDFASRKKSNR
jgi:acyl-CoA synthetase (AMP-forming)/AMP-acid ligase II